MMQGIFSWVQNSEASTSMENSSIFRQPLCCSKSTVELNCFTTRLAGSPYLYIKSVVTVAWIEEQLWKSLRTKILSDRLRFPRLKLVMFGGFSLAFVLSRSYRINVCFSSEVQLFCSFWTLSRLYVNCMIVLVDFDLLKHWFFYSVYVLDVFEFQIS